jgi:uncharacterized membrane protein
MSSFDHGSDDAPSGQPLGSSTSLPISPNLAGLLAYLIGWVSGLIILLLEKEHAEVRFHAAQSILVSVALIAISFVGGLFVVIPFIGPFIALLVTLLTTIGGLALWIYLLIQGFRLNHVELPVVGAYAAKLAGRA